jgi:hypothetical protein
MPPSPPALPLGTDGDDGGPSGLEVIAGMVGVILFALVPLVYLCCKRSNGEEKRDTTPGDHTLTMVSNGTDLSAADESSAPQSSLDSMPKPRTTSTLAPATELATQPASELAAEPAAEPSQESRSSVSQSQIQPTKPAPIPSEQLVAMVPADAPKFVKSYLSQKGLLDVPPKRKPS